MTVKAKAKPPALARGLDPARLAGAFARHGRLHIPAILRPADAQAVGAALAQAVPWHRSLTAAGKSYDIALDVLEAMPDDRRAAMARRARQRVLAEHTADRRAEQLESYLCEAREAAHVPYR